MALLGIAIGLYGYLFPVNINIMVMELFAKKKYRWLPFILILIVVFESIYCVLCLSFYTIIKSNTRFYHLAEEASFILIFILGIWMVIEKADSNKGTHHNTVIRGIVNIVIHPQQIPFWVVAGIFLSKAMVLDIRNLVFIAFVICNAIGTLLAMLLYMFLGNSILNYFKVNISLINKMVGAIYILLALYHWLLA